MVALDQVMRKMMNTRNRNPEELDEDAAEGVDAPHDDSRHGLGEEGMFMDLWSDLLSSHWLLNHLEHRE